MREIALLGIVLGFAGCGEGDVEPVLDAPPADAEVDTWATLLDRWQLLAPVTTAIVHDVSATSDCSTPLLEYQPDRVAATSSVFDVYLLAAIAERVQDDELAWDTAVTLVEEHLVPGGDCSEELLLPHCQPPGTEASLAELATFMVQADDNSATDHLLSLLGGAPAAEALLAALDHSAVERNQPFLTTRQLLTIKLLGWPRLAHEYVELTTTAARRSYLVEEIDPLDPFAVWPEEGLEWAQTGPRGIDDVEWFSSPRDLCRGLQALRALALADAKLRSILRLPFGEEQGVDPAIWPYLGLADGSEPGVRSTAVLAQHHTGRWIAIALTFNDPVAAPDLDGELDRAYLAVLPLVDGLLQ